MDLQETTCFTACVMPLSFNRELILCPTCARSYFLIYALHMTNQLVALAVIVTLIQHHILAWIELISTQTHRFLLEEKEIEPATLFQ